ncbi:hypothetical protein H312_00156 [Anncaliia algerae PRA339]|uniref:Uncharacterized protein n=1 Tax=Anncaliia algerae PRA339 TaxID=1288291 RepID=A0A059F5E3_9MICR|nr:hypothetical protein H312_00156 [Anncaliia algerae PRA339]
MENGLNIKLLDICSENEKLLLVLQDDQILVCGCILQINSDVVYIEALDTTGLCTPRNIQKMIINSLIHYICNLDIAIISVFSLPRKEIIFGGSEHNSLKGFYTPKKLEEFWKDRFSSTRLGKVHVYSNFTKNKSFPYKKLEHIRLFDDDPKRKTMSDDLDISTFFQTLLHRADFIKGSLIYLEKQEVTTTPEECVFDESSVVRRALNLLRQSDFSDKQNGIESTKQFLNSFYCESKELELIKIDEVKKAEEEILFLVPKNKLI